MEHATLPTKPDEEVKQEMNAADTIEEAENKSIEVVVVSVNGKTEGIIDLILDMKGDDYDFVKKEVENVSKDTGFLEQGQTPQVSTKEDSSPKK